MKLASTIAAVAFLAFGCAAPVTPVATVAAPSPQAEAGLFSDLGMMAGRACKLYLTGNQQDAADSLQNAGFAVAETSSRYEFYTRHLSDYRAGLTRVTVGLPTNPDLVGTLNCTARVYAVAKPEGDLFFRSFQIAGQTTNPEIQIPVYGRFEATYARVAIFMTLTRSRQGN